MDPWFLLPRMLLFFDALLPRERAGSGRVAAVRSFFARDLGFRGGNCNGLLANTGLFLSTGNRYPFLLQRLTIPFDSVPLLMMQFSHAWRQSFVIEVSDLYFFSPSSSICDSQVQRSSDESPCRTITIRFLS